MLRFVKAMLYFGRMNRSGAGTRAAYRELADSLRADILGGKYPPGHRLPTEAELESELGVSRQTIRRAYQDLVAEGLISRTPGRGTFATHDRGMYLRHFGSIDDLMGLSADTLMRVTRPLTRSVNVDAAGRLRAEADVVGMLEFVRLHNEEPFCVTDVYLPEASEQVLRDIQELQTENNISSTTVIELLVEHLESPIVEAEQSVTAVAAPDRVSELLGLRSGSPTLRIDRLYLTEEGTPVELAISHFRPDLYSYRLRLRRAGS